MLLEEIRIGAGLRRRALAFVQRAAPERESLVRVIVGRGGLVAGIAAGLFVAIATVLDRLLTVPFLYARPRDVAIHLSLEAVVAGFLAVCGSCVSTMLLALHRRVPPAKKRLVRLVVVGAAGIAAAAAGYVFVVVPSSRSAWLAPATWYVLLLTVGVGLSFAICRGLQATPRSPQSLGVAIVACALSLHLFGLHRYVRHYGNLQTFLLFAVVFASTLGCGLALGRLRRLPVAFWTAAAVVAACVLWLAGAGASPSYSARRAVLVWGGSAKRVMLDVVWPLADRDGDGTPSTFWGVDPDDRDPTVTPRTGAKPWPALESPSRPVELRPGRRNLLWVTVDTTRTDSFERILAESPKVQTAFAGFARYVNYVSCSTRTAQVAHRWFAGGRCHPADGFEGRSLLGMLRHLGYRDELLSYYRIGVEFQHTEYVKNDEALVERALGRLCEPGGGRALFVHLKGGHAEYDAPGDTPRSRYENQLRRAFDSVASLVVAAAPERWAVVVIGDHGEMFGEHHATSHATTLHEPELRTPLLVRGPSVPPGPAGVGLSCDGASLKALYALGVLERDPVPPPYQYASLDIAAWELGHVRGEQWRSLRTGTQKVIWAPELGTWELYDLFADPNEQRNLAEARPGELAPLRERLLALSRACPPR